MNGTQAQTIQHTHAGGGTERTEHTERTVAAGGSLLEASGAIATIALAIVGLAGVFPSTMAGIAAIVLGASVLTESGIHFSRFGRRGEFAMSEEAGSQVLGGLAGIVLGILALLGIVPAVLLAVSTIVFGATFLLSGQIVMGVGAAVLGILAVVGIDPWILILVGLLAMGAAALLSGATIGARSLSERVE